jgi:hypothetical protein
MDCPHCGKAFHDAWSESTLITIGPIRWSVAVTTCPACRQPTIDLKEMRFHLYSSESPSDAVNKFRAYPTDTFRRPTPTEVPSDIKEDYEEACKVLPTSRKASAALSRRCLQGILRNQGYTQKDLAKQIDALINESDPSKAIPTSLRQTVDVIRNFGNFSAHPVTDQTTLQVIAVEPNEAEWCLDILEELFDLYYVKPAQAAARKAALDAKLAAAKKPPSKGKP